MNHKMLSTLPNTQATQGPLAIVIAVCLPSNNDDHELLLTHIAAACKQALLDCSFIRLTPTTIAALAETLDASKIDFILCLDANYARLLSAACTSIHCGAPLIFADWGRPPIDDVSPALTCVYLVPEPAECVLQLCSLATTITKSGTIGILCDPADQTLYSLLPDITAWFTRRSYAVFTMLRKPTITTADITSLKSADILIFLSKTAPEEYMQRLITVCKQQGTVLQATTHTALAQGAPFAVAPDHAAHAHLLATLFTHHLTTSTLPQPACMPYLLLASGQEILKNQDLATTLEDFLHLTQNITIKAPSPTEKVSAYLRLEQLPLE